MPQSAQNYSARQAIANALVAYQQALQRKQTREQAALTELQAATEQAKRQRDAAKHQARAERDRQQASADQILTQMQATIRKMEAELKKAGLDYSKIVAIAPPTVPSPNEPTKLSLQKAYSQLNTIQVDFEQSLTSLAAVRKQFLVRLRKVFRLPP